MKNKKQFQRNNKFKKKSSKTGTRFLFCLFLFVSSSSSSSRFLSLKKRKSSEKEEKKKEKKSSEKMGSEPDPKLFDSSNRLVVSGAFVEVDEHYDLNSHCNGEYVAEKDLRNEKFCYCRIGEDGKILPGCIFFYMNKWMICRTGKGSTSEGWNFSQTSDDSDSRYPPLGSWKKEKGSGNDHPRTIDYSSLQVEQQVFFFYDSLVYCVFGFRTTQSFQRV